MLSLCLLSSCTPAVRQLPAVPPLSDSPQGDPARDAQSWLLREGYRAFVHNRYPTSALFLRRYLEAASDSPRSVEARWWLGRTYENLGDYRAAMAQYRLIATGPLRSQVYEAKHERQALRRLEELRQLHPDSHTGNTRQLALRFAMGALPPLPALAPWLQGIAPEGITALVIEPVALLFPGNSRHELKVIEDAVAIAHGIGLPLWVALDIHQGDVAALSPEWTAKTIANHRLSGESTKRPDIAADGFQAYLEALVTGLARTGCDGLVLTARSMPGFADEFSNDSLRDFAFSFDLNITPNELFEFKQSSKGQTWKRSATYWRWVGWKALRYATLVTRLGNALRKIHPTATVLIEVHQSTVAAQLEGLQQYGEDLVELISRTGGAVVLQYGDMGGNPSLEQLGQKLVPAFDSIWIGASIKAATDLPSIRLLKETIIKADISGQRNLLIQVLRAVPIEALP